MVLFSIGFVVLFYGATRGRQHMSNRVIDWLPEGFQETHDFYWFQAHFSETSLLMVSWDDCLLEDRRADKIAGRLTAPHGDGEEPFCQKVTTTGEIYRQLTSEPLNLSREEAFDRMTGWILSQDGRQGCLVVFLSKNGTAHPHEAIAEIRSVAAEETSLPPDKIVMAGPSIESVAIDDVSYQSQRQIVPFFLLTCVVILLCLLRSWIAVLAIFAAAVFNEELSGALIYYTGCNTDSISLLSASLLFVLTVSGSLHLLNYYR
ncbi:MAG: MMPL family transporter, partial [Thermoguttaceae bacterium]|nr:MMPL family transporter [Thermoguttaceae bacterium]